MFVRLRTTLFSSLLLAAAFALAACSQPQPTPDEAAQDSEPVSVKLIGFNDFHGNLEGPAGKVSVDGEDVPAGGVAQMKAHVDRISADEPNTIVVAAGDIIGASPLVSAVFHDEPAIEAMDAIGLELTAVGNHEFDRGWQELIRLQDGGCHPEEGCREGYEFAGAEFQYLAANVQNPDGEPLLPSHEVRTFGDVPVGFIGLVVDDAPKIISPTSIEGLSFRHEPEVINEVAAGLQKEGVEAIVVLIHEGGRPTTEQASIDDCGDIEGPIVDIVKESSDAVDVFVTGHSHQTYICEIDGKLVTSAESYGRLLTEIDLTIDPETGDVVEKAARNHVVSQDIEADAKLAKLVSTYVDLSAEVAQRPVGTINETISRETNDAGESRLGDVIADAQLAATSAPDKGGAQVAFMNPGGIRASLEADEDAEAPFEVTYEDLHRVQPFGNNLMTMTLTGKQIHDMLEMQWSGSHPKILQPSEGFTYTWVSDRAPGERIDPESMKLGGETVDPDGEYRVTVNSFLASGGDGFALLKDGTDRRAGQIDLEAFVDYVEKESPVKPGPQDRISVE